MNAGQVIAQRYEIRGILGRGGMGEVYLAFDRRLATEVALKRVPPELAVEPGVREALVREARILARLSDTYVVRLFDLADTPEGMFLVLEYVCGPSLDKVLAKRQTLSPRELQHVLDHVSQGLTRAHTGAAAAVTYFINVREQALGVHKLNPDKLGGPLPDRIGFVQLTGRLARKFATAYRDKDEMHLMVAIAGEDWNPNVPMRFFVHYKQFGTDEAAFAAPQEFRQGGAAEFGGRFGGKLPVFAERAMEKKGLKIDKDYRILNWERIPAGGAPQSDSHMVVLIVGGICSAALLAAMVGIKLKEPKPKQA